MNVLIFIVILGVLIFVHELGHFLFAKLFKVRVDEFGFGYPPKMFKMFRWRGTDFTMNWIPFGGFVKIFGEADDGKELTEEEKKVSLVYKPRWQQILVMFGGILFNILFAWLLLTGIFMSGVQTSLHSAPKNYHFQSTDLIVSSILPKSPAEKAGLQAGDIVKEYLSKNKDVLVKDEDIQDLAQFIREEGKTSDITFVVLRNGKVKALPVHPEKGIVGDNYSIGVGAERVGKLKLSLPQALWYSAKNSILLMRDIALGFWSLITGKISLDAVSGPVGIAQQVGSAADIGFTYLISFAAMLSLNLAVLNLIPFPALDGGRIFILLIESIRRKRLNPKIINAMNFIGFFLLIALMLLVTVKDVIKLF